MTQILFSDCNYVAVHPGLDGDYNSSGMIDLRTDSRGFEGVCLQRFPCKIV